MQRASAAPQTREWRDARCEALQALGAARRQTRARSAAPPLRAQGWRQSAQGYAPSMSGPTEKGDFGRDVLSGTLPRRSTLRWYLSVFTPARHHADAQTWRALALTRGVPLEHWGCCGSWQSATAAARPRARHIAAPRTTWRPSSWRRAAESAERAASKGGAQMQ